MVTYIVTYLRFINDHACLSQVALSQFCTVLRKFCLRISLCLSYEIPESFFCNALQHVLSLIFAGSDGDVIQIGSTFVRLLQRSSRPSFQRRLQLPVSSVVGAMSPRRVAALAAVASSPPPLPQVVYGNVTWPSWRPRDSGEWPRAEQRRDDCGRQRLSSDTATHQQVHV